MLDPWIIEEIIRREREEKQDRRIELPLINPPQYHDSEPQKPAPAEDKDRGVVVIDI